LIAVVNKRSVGLLRSLSNLNEMGGGIPFAQRGGILQDGGFAQRFINEPVQNSLELGQQFFDAISELPPGIVLVDDINTGQARRIKVKSRAEI